MTRCCRLAIARPDRGPLATAAALLGLAILCLPAAAGAQLPEEFTNLQVLPKDITQGELVGVMRGFAGALGTRCQFCHVYEGEDPNDLSAFDFASDHNEHKGTARVMMKMVRDINERYLPQTGKPAASLLEVTCYTCHRGLKEPRTLEDELRRALADGGAEAAVARYRELRAEHYGFGAYDFSGRTVARLAEELLREGRAADAKALLELNLEFIPDAGFSVWLLAEAHRELGEKDEAIAAYRKVLEMFPDHAEAQRHLKELTAEKAPDPKP